MVWEVFLHTLNIENKKARHLSFFLNSHGSSVCVNIYIFRQSEVGWHNFATAAIYQPWSSSEFPDEIMLLSRKLHILASFIWRLLELQHVSKTSVGMISGSKDKESIGIETKKEKGNGRENEREYHSGGAPPRTIKNNFLAAVISLQVSNRTNRRCKCNNISFFASLSTNQPFQWQI